MGLFDWLSVGKGGKAMSLYKRGMEKAKNHDHESAIECYSAALAIADPASEVCAMTLYNRALVYSASGEGDKAAQDLSKVLAGPDAFGNIKSMAKQKLARMETRTRLSGK